ncbi:MAG: hypothetical protein JRE23_16500, partial [Deltaproteobacteria bacterium]|nr:hypothetical protein [Deltaproteobacteria bacterium]
IRSEEIKVTTVGSAGVAVGATNSSAAIFGKIHAIYLDYHTSTPATADVTITERIGSVDRQTLHVETNSKTDVVRRPRVVMEDNAEAGVEYAAGFPIYEPYVIAGQIRVAVAQGDALTDAVVVTVIYEN